MKKTYPLLFLLFLLACEADDNEIESLGEDFYGYQYYPLAIQQEHIYQVDSIIYDDFTGRVDTFIHQRRELVQAAFVDDGGREAFEIGVFERASDTTNWVKKKTIIRLRTISRIEEQDENIRTIPFVFPISENKEWNSNALNTQEEETYRYISTTEQVTINSIVYDSTVLILQRQEENLIEKFDESEIYAINIGLIARNDVSLRTELDGTIISGYKASQTLLSFRN